MLLLFFLDRTCRPACYILRNDAPLFTATTPIYLMCTKVTSLLVYVTQLGAVASTTFDGVRCQSLHSQARTEEFVKRVCFSLTLAASYQPRDVSIDITYRVSQKPNDLSLAFPCDDEALATNNARVNLIAIDFTVSAKKSSDRRHNRAYPRISSNIANLTSPVSVSPNCFAVNGRKPPDGSYPSCLYRFAICRAPYHVYE